MEAAFKEWRVIVDTLGRGDQVVIMRKGGIDEGENGFEIKHQRFWLFPTQFHQQKDMVIPTVADQMEPSSINGTIPIQYHCEVVTHFELTQTDQITKLRGQHAWKDEVLIQRMTSGTRNQLHALLVRVSQLPTPKEITMQDEYGGCRSWIQLKESLNPNNTVPIIKEELFAKKIQAFKDAIS
ncbi:MAG: DUF1802 family protein [Verrucomicrobia bacterium]|jgi:hypothetical protein|nr:DUF1802 family protein [Verrucomicrobiota bacterium]